MANVLSWCYRRTMRERPWNRPMVRSRWTRWIRSLWWMTTARMIPVRLARELGIETIVHERNYGYGRNQKTCYREALRRGADIVVMVHPDYQYTPRLITAMASMIAYGVYDVVLGSRILGGKALRGGMPPYKYISNRFLTAFQNFLLRRSCPNSHTGYRAFSKKVLEMLPLEENSDDFVFDNEMLVQVIRFGFRIGEISCPTRYFEDASSISPLRAVRYGLGVISTTIRYLLDRHEIRKDPLFDSRGRRLSVNSGCATG